MHCTCTFDVMFMVFTLSVGQGCTNIQGKRILFVCIK